MLPLGSVIEELIKHAMAKGMSRRNAKREVAKLVQEKWQSGKIDIYGRRNADNSNSDNPLEVIPPDPDLHLVEVPPAKQ